MRLGYFPKERILSERLFPYMISHNKLNYLIFLTEVVNLDLGPKRSKSPYPVPGTHSSVDPKPDPLVSVLGISGTPRIQILGFLKSFWDLFGRL